MYQKTCVHVNTEEVTEEVLKSLAEATEKWPA